MQDTSSPNISAIIVTYNRRPQLSRAIDSILSQTPAPHEIIVVDDGSTDGTIDYLRERYGDSVKIIAQLHGGVSAARRRGVLEATGDWIAFLDSDDTWAEGRLNLMRQAMHKAPPDTRWIFGDSKFVYRDRSTTVFSENGWAVDADVMAVDEPMNAQYPYMFSMLPSSIVQRKALIEAGCFSENLETSEDLLVSFRIALMGPIACVRDVVTIVDRTGRDDSLARRGERGPDYFRARVLAFDDVARKLGWRKWGALHASSVRGWCIALAHCGETCRAEAFLQFKHTASAKEILFLIFALCGAWAVRLWSITSRLAQSPQWARTGAPL